MNKWMIWGETPLFLVQHPYNDPWPHGFFFWKTCRVLFWSLTKVIHQPRILGCKQFPAGFFFLLLGLVVIFMHIFTWKMFNDSMWVFFFWMCMMCQIFNFWNGNLGGGTSSTIATRNRSCQSLWWVAADDCKPRPRRLQRQDGGDELLDIFGYWRDLPRRPPASDIGNKMKYT